MQLLFFLIEIYLFSVKWCWCVLLFHIWYNTIKYHFLCEYNESKKQTTEVYVVDYLIFGFCSCLFCFQLILCLCCLVILLHMLYQPPGWNYVKRLNILNPRHKKLWSLLYNAVSEFDAFVSDKSLPLCCKQVSQHALISHLG